MRLMPVTDAMFLWGESREMPMHIGGINLYTLPDGVDETEWLNEQLTLLRQSEGLRRPFSEVLKLTPFGQYGPIRLVPDRDIDITLPEPVSDALAVRFTSLADESDEPGFSELEVFGP